jgi:hypothetical protein
MEPKEQCPMRTHFLFLKLGTTKIKPTKKVRKFWREAKPKYREKKKGEILEDD